jgi:hypothetical protein
MSTKMVEISRIFSSDFWHTETGEAWLTRNWPAIVEWPVDEVKEWARAHNSRARRKE